MNKRICTLASDFTNPPRLGVMSQAGEVEAAFYDADDRRLYMAGAAMLSVMKRVAGIPGAMADIARAGIWDDFQAAIAAAEGRETADAPKAEPTPADFEQRRDGWLIAFVPISSAARQWSIDASPKGARWEHERWYAQKNRAPAVRHAIEVEGFTVREG